MKAGLRKTHRNKPVKMAIKTALLTAEKIRQGQMSLADFAQKINNTEYNFEE